MFSLANNFSKLNYNVHVIPDHKFSTTENFRTTNLSLPKIFRPIAKRLYLKYLNETDNIIFCDTWKSIKAVPQNYNNIVLFAHGQEYLNKRRNKKRISESLSRTKFLVCSSKYTLNLIERSWDISKLKFTVIYPTYHIKKSKHKYFQRNNKKINFVSICRIEKRKGLLESLKSMRVILDRGYSFKWDIIGDGPELNTLKNEAKKLNLQENIIFHGKIESDIEKEKFLEKSDIFLMPSFQNKYSVEGFGLSYVEASKFGIPSIAGNSGGAREAIINNNTGWCANTQNNEELTSILIEAITNSKLRHLYGKNALKRFESELNADIVTNQLIDFIKI